ncbi:unnamed protein product, partial [Pieris macdunnoughi]
CQMVKNGMNWAKMKMKEGQTNKAMGRRDRKERLNWDDKNLTNCWTDAEDFIQYPLWAPFNSSGPRIRHGCGNALRVPVMNE